MSATPSTSERIEGLSKAIADARRQVQNGERIELDRIQSEAEALCGEMAGAGPDEARSHTKTLEALVIELDALANDIAECKGRLEARLEALSSGAAEPA